MKLVKGMLLAAMLAAGSAGAAEKAADAAGGDRGGGGLDAASPIPGSGNPGDDEWACKVAMCMSNPGGPTEFAECVEPIDRLRRHLAKGRSVPVCPFIGTDGGQDDDAGSRSGGGRLDPGERDPAQAL
ncbi:hypothetical protein ACFPOA_02330 [Lysobacter niabensis]|uniref:hypothetical protein n=1 Tax=Agrilutibacter niabensis TaxID=380628 RepID=UPI00361173E5